MSFLYNGHNSSTESISGILFCEIRNRSNSSVGRIPTMNSVRSTTDAVIVQSAITITAMLGLLGNILSVIVLRTPSMKSAYSLLLIALTISDSVQLVINLIHFGGLLLGISKSSFDANPNFSMGVSMMSYTAVTTSSYFTVLLSFERYIAVSNPFKALQFITKRKVFHYVLVIVFFSILFNLPKWWEYQGCLDVGTKLVRLTPTALFKNPVYRSLYAFWANAAVNFFVPLIILSVLNVLIYNGILKANKLKESIGQTPQDMSITIMLVVVVVVFCMCNMFFCIIGLVRHFCSTCKSLALTRVQNYLYTFNASINFVIYCLCGTKFRKQFWMLFYRVRKRVLCTGGGVTYNIRGQENRSSITGNTMTSL